MPGLLVVRMGINTMSDERLSESAEQCHENWGFWGFSVLEVHFRGPIDNPAYRRTP